MKELLLQARVDASPADTPPDTLCRWIEALAGASASPGGETPSKLFHTPSPGRLEVWLPADAADSSSPGAMRYHRLSFCPLPPGRDAGDAAAFSLEVELLSPCEVYRGGTLLEVCRLGVLPRLVVLEGWVLAFDALTAAQIGRSGQMYAVLTPALAARLGVRGGCRGVAAGRVPCDAARLGLERLLPRCFPGGGEAAGCPLHLSLAPTDVPAARLLRVGDGQRALRFGASGEGVDPLAAFPLYGAFRPGRFKVAEVVMLYPAGGLEAARRLFGHLSGLLLGLGVLPLGGEGSWRSYDAAGAAEEQLLPALYEMPPVEDASACRICCLLVPGGGAGDTSLPSGSPALRSARLSDRLRRALCFPGCFYWGPVPLHAPGSGAFAGRLPAVASRLLLEMGGMPWVPLRFASQATDLIAGLSCPPSPPGEELFCAAAFYNDPVRYCSPELCRPSGRFDGEFQLCFRRAYEEFYDTHGGVAPRRLVVYCHRHHPLTRLSALVEWMGAFPEALPVVLVQVRRTSGSLPRYYDPDAPGCQPPVGTCVYNADGSALLFGRSAASPASGRGLLRVSPLELFPRLLLPDGRLEPLPRKESDAILVQACQLVWADPCCPEGASLPLVLSRADRLARLRRGEWQAEVEACVAIRRESGNLAI